MTKKIGAILLALCLFLGGMPITARAQEQNSLTKTAGTAEPDKNGDYISDNGYIYTVTESTLTATITGYTSSVTALTVPTTITVPASTGFNTSTDAKVYTVTTIGAGAFLGKGGMTSIVLPEGLLSIGANAFYGCMSVTKVTLPKSLTSIGSQAFADCIALTAFTVTAGNDKYCAIDSALYQYTRGMDGLYGYTLIQYPVGKGGTSFTAPSTTAMTGRLIGIGDGAFAACTTMTDITLPDTVTSIGSYAFQGCSSLTNLNLPASLTHIGDYAFSGLQLWKKADIPATVTSIGSYAFENCKTLTSITLPEKLTYMGMAAFKNCTGLTQISVPSGLTYLNSYVFQGCTSLAKVTIPTTITSVGSYAFDGCTRLTIYAHSNSAGAKYAIANSIPIVYTYTVSFYNGSKLISRQEVEPGGDAVPPTLTGAEGYELFWSGSYQDITGDATLSAVWKIVYYVTFKDDYNDRSETVSVPTGTAAQAPSWTMTNYRLKWDKSFSAVTANMTVNASWVNVNNGFVVTGDTAKPAAKATKLTSATKTYVVTNADPSTPRVRLTGTSNTSATTLSVPAKITVNGVSYGVTSIGASAFSGNKKLKSVSIGSNVVSIGSKAFYGCSNVATVRIYSKKVTTIGSNAFRGILAKAVIRVPSARLSKYKSLLKKSGIGRKVTVRTL